MVQRFGTLAAAGAAPPDRTRVDAGRGRPAVDLALDEHVVAALNGDQITRTPSCRWRGDTVGFMVADAGG